MAVEHSTLTGSALHEPKGVASAASGTVYVADGVGSGAWTSLGTSTNPFGTQLFHIRDQVASGVAALSFSTPGWSTRRLQTSVTNEISSASLASNQLSLPSGTYFIIAHASMTVTGSSVTSKLRLRNITGGVTLISGQGYITTSSTYDQVLTGRFTLGSTTTVELQNYVTGASAASQGIATSTGENEVYTDVLIWKIS